MSNCFAVALAVVLPLAALPPAPGGAPDAFPGAEGFGAASRGGRGGAVVKVTNLNVSGPGSLQAACDTPGPRIVVFDVSGVIRGDVILRHGEITIAGQTAPGAGITIEGQLQNPYRIKPNLHDVTIRHIRVRPRRWDKVWAGGDCIQLTYVERLILDHVSVSWGNDENIDLCNSRDLTVQWCAIEESDTTGHEKGQHNFGLIMGYSGRDATVHHNLFAHHLRRAPLCGLEVLDHRNNVIYNMRRGVYWHPAKMNQQRPGKGFRANVVGNYFKHGPDAPKAGRDLREAIVDATPEEELYARGNHFTWAGAVEDLWKHPLDQGIFKAYPQRFDSPWPAPPVETHSAEEAYRLVLAMAGCLPRDTVSRRTVEEVRAGGGSWGRHDAADLMEGLEPGSAPADADGDGMPDAWERARKLDPHDASDAARVVPAGASPRDRHRGYTYIEYYVNDAADRLAAAARRR